MNRKQAIKLIQEIEEECKDITGRSLVLISPDPDNALSAGYLVQIKAKLDASKLRCIETVAQVNECSVKNEPENKSIFIYKPKGRPKKPQDNSGSPSM